MMNTKQAVLSVLSKYNITKYRLASNLACSPTSVSQWLRGTRMSQAYADKFEDLYGIEIKDKV